MNNPKYESLLREFCEVVNVKEVDALLETGHLRIDDCDLALMHDEQLDAEAIFVYVDFGELPADKKKVDSYRSMLQANYFIGSPHDGQLSIQPETGRAVLAARVVMSRVDDGNEFAEILSGYVEQAEQWRDSAKEKESAAQPIGPAPDELARAFWS